MKKIPFLFIILCSCSHMNDQVDRKIASLEMQVPDFSDLTKASDKILNDVKSENFPKACVSYLTSLEKRIDALDIRNFKKEKLKRDGEKIAEKSWLIRKALHERLREVKKDCAQQMLVNFRQFRFIEDYLLEIVNDVKHLNPKEIVFDKQLIPIKKNPKYYSLRLSQSKASSNFLPGDILVARGVSFLSAMIARLGKISTQFSHIAWIHQDPNTKSIKTIESYVGKGVNFYEIDAALKNENARLLWLRSKNRDLALEADRRIAELIKKEHIKYDYTLDFDDSSSMSCAEVSQVAFKIASGGEFSIPQYPNEISGAFPLTKRLKMKQGPTFEPGDMEIDSRFELVGEFKDLRLTRDSRQKDVILTAMFKWMNEYGYELHDSTKSQMAGGPIYQVRRTFLWPLVQKILKLDDFSKEIPANMLSTVTLLNQIGEQIQEIILKKDDEFLKKNGLPMTMNDLYKVLEDLRQKDLKIYQTMETRKDAKFHQWFRPKSV